MALSKSRFLSYKQPAFRWWGGGWSTALIKKNIMINSRFLVKAPKNMKEKGGTPKNVNKPDD